MKFVQCAQFRILIEFKPNDFALPSLPNPLKITITLLLLLFASVTSADEGIACLLKHYDEYIENRITLFEKVDVVYKAKYPKIYKVYKPVLAGQRLFEKINQLVFHHFIEHDISKLKLRHGFINATPNWIKDACNGRDCVNALHVKLTKLPGFNTLYAQWSIARKQTKKSYAQKGIAQAGSTYFKLLGEKDVLPHALKDMRYYGLKVDKLVCE